MTPEPAQFLIGGYTILQLSTAFAAVMTPIAVAVVGGYVALRNGSRSNRTEQARVDLDEFAAFREAYAADRDAMRQELDEIKDLVARLGGLLRRTRAAFRAYVRRVHDDWGRTDHPPVIDAEVRDLLAEDDWDNTLGRAEVSAAVDEARREDTTRGTPHA